MAHYTVHVFGIDLSHVFDDLPEELQEELSDGKWGRSMYDGGGYGQLTYIGAKVPFTKRGIIVTDEVEAEARRIYGAIPEEVRKAISAALLDVGMDVEGTRHSEGLKARLAQGLLPEPEFIELGGWG
jgi:hypothetical protein